MAKSTIRAAMRKARQAMRFSFLSAEDKKIFPDTSRVWTIFGGKFEGAFQDYAGMNPFRLPTQFK